MSAATRSPIAPGRYVLALAVFAAVLLIGSIAAAGCASLQKPDSREGTAAIATAVPQRPATPTVVLARPRSLIPAPPVVAVGDGPRIWFPNEEIDFGEVKFGEIVPAAFEFKNIGNQPLIVSKVQIRVLEGC